MGRPLLVVAVIAVALLLATGCGSEGQVSDREIIEALELEPSPDRPAYTVGGDPFCEVNDDLLNSSEEVEVASEGDELGLVITSSDEDVGIAARPPFDPKCARTARKGLDSLE